MSVKAIFFDAGNTLLACDPPVEKVYGQAFAAYGLEASFDAVRAALRETWIEVRAKRRDGNDLWNGEGGELAFWRAFVSTVFSRLGGGPLPEQMFLDLVAHFQRPQHWAVYPEVPDVLDRLREAGYRLLVVSNWDSSLPALLTRLDLARHFDHIVVSSIIGASKPSPRIFEVALSHASAAPHEALHIGDSLEEDYEGARRAGLGALLLDRDQLTPELPDSITSLSEIQTHLDRSS